MVHARTVFEIAILYDQNLDRALLFAVLFRGKQKSVHNVAYFVKHLLLVVAIL